jgi:hypothetical protein
MPSDSRALTRAARTRSAADGVPYTKARETELAIRARMKDAGETYTEAEAAVQSVEGLEFCDRCGGPIICPECPGCACYNGRCTGWRHTGSVDFERDEDPDPLDDVCEECGGSERLAGYDAGCVC